MIKPTKGQKKIETITDIDTKRDKETETETETEKFRTKVEREIAHQIMAKAIFFSPWRKLVYSVSPEFAGRGMNGKKNHQGKRQDRRRHASYLVSFPLTLPYPLPLPLSSFPDPTRFNQTKTNDQ
jgi:hypothetical protein